LFFRLAVTRIELPPLRERRGDIAVLAAHFWRTLGGEGQPPYELVQHLEGERWPGNVRELRNAIARRLALGELSMPQQAPTLPAVASAPDLVESVLARELPFPRARDAMLREFERRYVERVLGRHGGT
jgi:DNA-binding NtrC family response regulator